MLVFYRFCVFLTLRGYIGDGFKLILVAKIAEIVSGFMVVYNVSELGNKTSNVRY